MILSSGFSPLTTFRFLNLVVVLFSLDGLPELFYGKFIRFLVECDLIMKFLALLGLLLGYFLAIWRPRMF